MRRLLFFPITLLLSGPAWAQTNVAMQVVDYQSKATSGSISIAGVAGFTLQGWFRRDGGSNVVNFPMVMASAASPGNLWNGSASPLGIGITTLSGTPKIYYWDGSAVQNTNIFPDTTNMVTGSWYHFSLTYTFNDATEGNKGVVRSWIRMPDGSLYDPDTDGVTKKVILSAAITNVTSNRVIGLGGYYTSASINLTTVADPRFWWKPLSGADIAANWDRRLNSTELADADLQAYYYPTEQGSGDTALEAEDASGPTLTLAGTWNWVQGPPQLNAAPDAPVLSSTGHTAGSVTLDWADVSGSDSYKVYRDAVLLEEGVLVSTYVDDTCAPSTEYDYVVKACAGVACSADSNTVTVTTDPDTTDPTAGALTLTGRTHDSLTVNVGAGSDDVGVTSRVLRVYSDELRTVQVGSDIPVTAGDNTVSGLSQATPAHALTT